MYAEFTVHGYSFHYVTAAPTSVVGDMMFYVNKDRGSALLDTSNSNFMSVVLSDPNTVIGPLWKNHTAVYTPVFRTYTTNILNDEPLRDEGPGELFVYSKTGVDSTIGSPGYVVVDFDITFRTLQTNYRDLTFPIARLKYAHYGLGYATDVATTAGVEAVMRTNTSRLDGTASIISNDPAARLGDVYKVVMCPQYGAYAGGVSPSNLLLYQTRVGVETAVGNTAITIDDGFTCFGVYNSATNGTMMLYPTFVGAMSQQSPYLWGVTTTASQWTLPSWLSLVGNVGAVTFQSNF